MPLHKSRQCGTILAFKIPVSEGGLAKIWSVLVDGLGQLKVFLQNISVIARFLHKSAAFLFETT